MDDKLKLLFIQRQKLHDFYTVKRLNPYNPLNYLIVLLVSIEGIIFFGVVGYWEKAKNPFKWD